MLLTSVALAGFEVTDASWLRAWIPAPEAEAPAPAPAPASPERIPADPAPTPAPRPIASQGCGPPEDLPVTRVRSTLGMGPGTPQDGRIESTIRRKMGQLKHCYEEALKHDPTLDGRIEVDWRIEHGRVWDVRASSTLDPESLSPESPERGVLARWPPGFVACVTSKVKRWHFDDALTTEVHWPFVFHPVDVVTLDPLAIP